MDIISMQVLAGVPVTKKEKITESNSDITRPVNKFIKSLDSKMSTSANREYKSEWSTVASDFEDIAMLIKADKKYKANKLFNDLDKKYQNSFFNSLASKHLENVKKYFTQINEACSEDEEEIQSDEISQEEQSIETDMVDCPLCDCDKMNKIDFYDHIMDNHIEDEECDQDSDDIEIEFGTENIPNDTDVTEAVDATVWDKTEDKDESPVATTDNGDDKISLPKNIKDQLETEIKELQKSSEELEISDYLTAKFQNDTANVMIDTLNHLKTETEMSMKLAQILISTLTSTMVQKFPKDVYDFILHGGYDTKEKTENSLVSMFKEIKQDK